MARLIRVGFARVGCQDAVVEILRFAQDDNVLFL